MRPNTVPRMIAAFAAVSLVAACSGENGTGDGSAEGYPDQNITIVVPFSAGGPTDTVTRMIAEPMAAALGGKIVVQNVEGAGGTVAAGQVATARPDGYTVLMHHIGMSTARFIVHGITPGPNVITEEPALFWGLIASMWIGNVLLVLLYLPLIGIWVRLLRIPYRVLFPMIVLFAVIGTYSLSSNAYDVYAIAFFGLLGYVLIKCGCEPAPLLLGFVLGPLLEDNLRRALIISRGDPSVFVTRPISAALLALTVTALVVAALPAIRRRREEVFTEDE